MTMPEIRTLPFATRTGTGNMAADEVMLHTAAERGTASFRAYSWTSPTLSLGYFQPSADRDLTEKLASLDWVRRATGGAAIVHDPFTELTYSIALPAGAPWQTRGDAWICRMHGYLRETLQSVWGIESKLLVCGAETKLGPVLCFQHQTAGDLLIGAHKIAGSAQRKQKGALLQHGSILLRHSAIAPQLPGIAELTEISIPAEELAIGFIRRLAVETGWHPHSSDWTDEEFAEVEQIENEKYKSAVWNHKR